MKRIIAFMTVLFGVFFAISFCSKDNKVKQTYKSPFPTDTLIKVTSAADSQISYILYLPPKYKDNGKFPVIYCFDPHADGKKIVEKFVPAAKKYNYVLVGSENFRNNVPDLAHILDNTIDDVKKRLNININRQYTAGFSGGARVAALLAFSDSTYKGLAQMSAGLPLGQYPKNPNLAIIQFTGTQDFNYLEVINSNRFLSRSKAFKYQMILFRGKHQYPNSRTLESAILWFDVKAIRQGLKKNNPIFKKQLKNYLDSLIENSYNSYYKHLNLKLAINFGKDIININKYQEQLLEIEQSTKYKQELNKLSQLIDMEISLQRQYLLKLKSNDIDTSWWKHEINIINDKIQSAQDSDYLDLYHRVKSYISIMLFSFLNSGYNANLSTDLLFKYNTIYKYLEPENPDVYYFLSCYYAKKQNNQKAFFYLRKAIKLGFDDSYRLKAKCFDNIKNTKQFNEIINGY